MEITKKRLKTLIKEEMLLLAETGDIKMISESERKAFQIILEKLTEEDLQLYGLRKIR